jgi:ATP-dependent Lon protease
MVGKGDLMVTGQLGDVMRESAMAALSYIRTRAYELHIDPSFQEGTDLHIHLPEGAIPKDGPSAGITIATALVSALTRRPVRGDIAMTGEVTLLGTVLPIGGLKEKVLAAQQANITHIIIPAGNQKDLAEIPAKVRQHMRFTPVHNMDQVIELALLDALPAEEAEGDNQQKEPLPLRRDEHMIVHKPGARRNTASDDDAQNEHENHDLDPSDLILPSTDHGSQDFYPHARTEQNGREE